MKTYKLVKLIKTDADYYCIINWKSIALTNISRNPFKLKKLNTGSCVYDGNVIYTFRIQDQECIVDCLNKLKEIPEMFL